MEMFKLLVFLLELMILNFFSLMSPFNLLFIKEFIGKLIHSSLRNTL